MENYSLLMGAAVMKMAVEMAAVSMERSRGTSPLGRVRTDSCPPDLGFAMTAAGTFLVSWLFPFRMKLNPAKCTFGVPAGQLLGYLVSRGIANRRRSNYPHYQKVTYGVYMAAKKLKHYFQEHPIKVVATPLAEIIGSKDANGRVAKWALELAAHTIIYEPRTAIKSQILTGFFVDGPRCNTCRRA
ncbi:hypothetical protein QYE76_043734 [Lolium multiflorum]|uniref:Reverse transcriptase RNase H-like domain-containing protein n=1 Tax=Lolium multiflorum TaxID=4521 RepID=A0AAD8TJQ7_LOLMU|nr:hypothetical protein QYE76_043734 [Lolium multiflorum]